MSTSKNHVDELLKLPREERSAAAEALLLSLEQDAENDGGAIEQAWATEIERRVAEDAPGISAERALAEAGSACNGGRETDELAPAARDELGATAQHYEAERPGHGLRDQRSRRARQFDGIRLHDDVVLSA